MHEDGAVANHHEQRNNIRSIPLALLGQKEKHHEVKFKYALGAEPFAVPEEPQSDEAEDPKHAALSNLKSEVMEHLEQNKKYEKITEKNRQLVQLKQLGDLQMFQHMKHLNDQENLVIPVEIGEENFDGDMGIRINSKERIEDAYRPQNPQFRPGQHQSTRQSPSPDRSDLDDVGTLRLDQGEGLFDYSPLKFASFREKIDNNRAGLGTPVSSSDPKSQGLHETIDFDKMEVIPEQPKGKSHLKNNRFFLNKHAAFNRKNLQTMNLANRRALATNMHQIKEMKKRKGYHASLLGDHSLDKTTKERSHSPFDGERLTSDHVKDPRR